MTACEIVQTRDDLVYEVDEVIAFSLSTENPNIDIINFSTLLEVVDNDGKSIIF